MRISVERLRIWLLAGAALLVLVVAGFLALARWRAHRFLTDLPAKLGVDIRQETNAFTYSQTVKGRTVFTVHAAKAIQHNDEKYTLHDVRIAVYGHGEAMAGIAAGEKQGDRVDRIYGKEFDLDQNKGIVKAVGEVHLDLEAPSSKGAQNKDAQANGTETKPVTPSSGAALPPGHKENLHEVGRGDKSLIHVKTSNLVYLQKLGIAASDEEIEFEYNGLTGHAHGAEYNSDTGILRLQSAVKVSGLENGRPILLTASRAELDRASRRVTLSDADYLTVSGDANGSRQKVRSRHAVVFLRDGGGIEHMTGDSGVTITAGDGMTVTGDRGEVFVNEAGRPTAARIWDNVSYAADDATRHAKGGSSEAKLAFDRLGHVQHVSLHGGVDLTERVLMGAPAEQRWSNRDLKTSSVEIGLATDASGRSRPVDAQATGGARLHTVEAALGGKGTRSSAMSADVLTARFVTDASGHSRLDILKGTGGTTLEQVNEAGVTETSTGDQLDVRFRAAAKAASSAKAGDLQGAEIASAVQQGHVVVTRRTPVRGEAPQTDKATAERADYDGGSHTLSLSGQVQLTGTEGMVWADRVLVDQQTGDAQAIDHVKASYRQAAQASEVHVLASRAEMKKANGTAIFHGESGKAARLWQAGSQVEAPLLEFNQKQRSLLARGQGPGMEVRTVLVSAGEQSGVTRPGRTSETAARSGLSRRAGVVRIVSREMRYADQAREAEFTGGVRVESADGVMRGDRAVAMLESADEKKASRSQGAAGLLGGSVEKVTVSGDIQIDQPGRRATGSLLVYTAGDGLFVLTGTPAVPPKVVDQAKGIVTGAQLSFRASDESVVISNGVEGGMRPRVHTETKVKRDR